MPRTQPARWILAFGLAAGLLAFGCLGIVKNADAAITSGGGGLAVPGSPRVLDVTCVDQCVAPRKATPGSTLRVKGANLDYTTRVVFPAKGGPASAKAITRSRGLVKVELPETAVAGRPWVVDANGNRSNRSPKKLQVLPESAIPTEVFPVLGPVDFGSSGAKFGAGRSGHTHQGQDMMASCGTKIVAARAGRVTFSTYQSAAGNYVVIKNFGSNTSFAYMHMIKPSPMKVGRRVAAGQVIGRVGSTGSSTACHLHFEYWKGPWQQGGTPINPLPYLKGLLAERRR